MKKNFKYAILSAIALVGAVSLTSCSSSDDVIDNPDFNPVDNTVKTQFAFSISKGGAKSTTRQTTGIVQVDATDDTQPIGHNDFRGMKKMTLIPFGAQPDATSSPLGPVIGPLTMDKTSAASSTASSYNNSNNDAVVYTNITVPTTTSYFLFYGQASEVENSTKAQNGALNVVGLYNTETTYNFTTPGSIYFNPVGIYNDQQNDTKIAVGDNIITLLNSLLTAKDGTGEDAKTWSQYTASDNSLLNDLYAKYIQLKTASSYSVAAMLVDLYASLEGIANTVEGTTGRTMAIALRSAIKAGFTDPDTSDDADYVAEANFSYSGYPGNLGLPDGAAKLNFAAATGFAIATGGTTDPNPGNYPTGTISVTSYTDYVYPANLQYYVRSDIKTSAQQQSSNFTNKTSWAECYALYTAGTSVTSGTKSVALVQEIQYGVGNLKIVINNLTAEKYYDSKAEEIDLTAETPFTLTGVLIGGQGSVGWNFKPIAAVNGGYTIYDNVINTPALTKTASAKNYTLGLQTVNVPETPDGTTGIVYIALELRNDTGKDFMGKDGLIPAGGKFYLAGMLNPSAASNANAEDLTDVKSVYKQDYMTTAILTIKPGTLSDTNNDGIKDTAVDGFAEATNTVPDLRTPQTEVCFSVNLAWKPGLTFGIDL